MKKMSYFNVTQQARQHSAYTTQLSVQRKWPYNNLTGHLTVPGLLKRQLHKRLNENSSFLFQTALILNTHWRSQCHTTPTANARTHTQLWVTWMT